LQEQEHHKEDEDDRHEQRLDHLPDRELDERRGVVGEDHLDVWRELLADLERARLDREHGRKRVGAGSELDPDPGSRHAVPLGLDAIVLSADRDAGDVAEANDRAVDTTLEADRRELIRGREARLNGHRRVQHLPLRRGLRADLSG